MKNRVTTYEALSVEQRQQVLQIELADEQKRSVGDIHGVLHALTARPSSDIQGFALLVDDVPRGFFLLKRRSLLPQWARGRTATLHGLMIDRRYQGLGLGAACMGELPALALCLWPDVERLMLAVAPDNRRALALYRAWGWVFSDEPADAAGGERLMSRHLP